MAPRNPQDPGDRRNPWTRPGYITAATFLGALVILAIILVATSGSGTTHTTQTQASNPTTTATTTQTSATTTTRSANPDRLHPRRREARASRPASAATGTNGAQVGAMSAPQAPTTLGPQRRKRPMEQVLRTQPIRCAPRCVQLLG